MSEGPADLKDGGAAHVFHLLVIVFSEHGDESSEALVVVDRWHVPPQIKLGAVLEQDQDHVQVFLLYHDALSLSLQIELVKRDSAAILGI